MALWCQHLQTVIVPTGATPKRVTLVLPFYENHQFIETQIAQWLYWPSNVSEHVEVIVVDDGSPKPLRSLHVSSVRLRQFRIDVDIRWNWLAARNIGAHHAAGEWLLMTDMDHIVPSETLGRVVFGRHDEKVVYAFKRFDHSSGELVNPHSASFLMTKAMFWKIGGYDEGLSGYYGSDGDWRRRVAQKAPIHLVSDALIRHEHIGDSSTTRYKRKQPEDKAVSRIVAARKPGWKPKTLSFPYHEVLQEVPCHAQA